MSLACSRIALIGWLCGFAGSVVCGQGRVFYVAPAGADNAAGTITQPWRTVARGVSALAIGDTLNLRAGVYLESGITVPVSGSSTQPIRIQSMPGETAVIDGSLPNFQVVPNKAWEPIDAYPDVYRSVATFPGLGQVYGSFGAGDGSYALVPYESLAHLVATNQEYNGANPCYVGPGVFWNSVDQRIYIRLTRSRPQLRMGYHVPTSVDPGRVELFVYSSASLFRVGAASWIVLDSLTLRHCEDLLELQSGSRFVHIRNCTFVGARYQILVRSGARDLTFTGCSVSGHFPPWIARSDVKRPETSPPPAHLLQGAGMELGGQVSGVDISGCTFFDLFDGIDTFGGVNRLAIHDNQFRTIRDDAFELSTSGFKVDFSHNWITNAAAGVSWNGSSAPPSAFRGTKYIHHNVIDTSLRQFYGRDDPYRLLPATWRGPARDGMATGRAFADHDTSSLISPDPWKVYHNTIVGAEDVDEGGFGLSYRFPGSAAAPHEVYNNIFVQTADHCIVEDARVADGSQVFDGNVYFRTINSPSHPLLEDLDMSGVAVDFPGLANFIGSAHWQATRVFYAPGWESSGIEANPGLDATYRPATKGPAHRPGVDLTGKSWPENARVAYRGALAPR